MISCESWQSRHVAASSWPAFSARPWTLALKLSVCRAWHRPQFTGAAGWLSSGCFAVMSAWKLLKALVLCADIFNLAASTNSEMALPAELVLNSVLSAWQSRQSLFFKPAKAGSTANRKSGKSREKRRFIPQLSWKRPRKTPPVLPTTRQFLNWKTTMNRGWPVEFMRNSRNHLQSEWRKCFVGVWLATGGPGVFSPKKKIPPPPPSPPPGGPQFWKKKAPPPGFF